MILQILPRVRIFQLRLRNAHATHDFI